MQISRDATPPLQPFVRRVWVLDNTDRDDERERVLPTGLMHLAFRLSGAPFGLSQGETVGIDVIGGARSSVYVKRLSRGRSIGVQLGPGAASLLFGVPADALAERHTSLGDL